MGVTCFALEEIRVALPIPIPFRKRKAPFRIVP